mmetsp:Transcript_7324/g.14059  ORF Transcript_7324/g.14059 Transcript_7324/m.14059 type:complete len:338 (-) Transcript_7324:125-1138(-)
MKTENKKKAEKNQKRKREKLTPQNYKVKPLMSGTCPHILRRVAASAMSAALARPAALRLARLRATVRSEAFAAIGACGAAAMYTLRQRAYASEVKTYSSSDVAAMRREGLKLRLRQTISDEQRERLLYHMDALGLNDSQRIAYQQKLSDMFLHLCNDDLLFRLPTQEEHAAALANVQSAEEREALIAGRTFMSIFDQDKDGTWEFHEFAETYLLLARATHGSVEANTDLLFQALDRNKDGVLQSSEIVTWYERLYAAGVLGGGPSNKSMRDETTHNMADFFMTHADANADGRLTKSEITEMFKKMREKNGRILDIVDITKQYRWLQAAQKKGLKHDR